MSGLSVSEQARRFVIALAQAGPVEKRRQHGPSVAAIMRGLEINRRSAKRVIAELVDLAWIHRQDGVWELMPEGENAAAWYRESGEVRP